VNVTSTLELPEREARFVHALAAGSRPCRAAVEAGFAISYGRRLLDKPRVRAALLALSTNARSALRDSEQ